MSTNLAAMVQEIVDAVPVLDIHTHLYLPSFNLTLWGIDELLTYHYLVAETMRFADVDPEDFFASPKPAQADMVWETLFVRNTPVSEATTGVLTVLSAFGLDPAAKNLREAREYFYNQDASDQIDQVFKLTGVKSLVMTNDPFDPREAPLWDNVKGDSRFHAALRLDPLVNGWPNLAGERSIMGLEVSDSSDLSDLSAVRKFLESWIKKMSPKYAAISLPPTFAFPEDSHRIQVLTEAVLPVCRDHGLPFAMMIGVRKRVNPRLGDAGDSVGFSDMGVVERLCAEFPHNRFLVTVLARENQQALCVAARKFSNLLPFGCWWFMNNPSLVEETSLLRLEMLGTSFVPQHSDARVLEQMVYKWKHARRDVGKALTRRYAAMEESGRQVQREEVERDARALFHDNAAAWIGA